MTAMTEITRNGSKSARGLISIQSRFNQILDDSSSTGKKLTNWYKEHNIKIKDQNGQLRSFFDVGKDVAEQWGTMSDNEKKYYMNIQAGANQSQNLAALMKNYKTALEATATAEESAGSAAKENARYMESMEGKLQNLKSAWEKFSYRMINSDLLKDGIDALTKALDFLGSDGGQALIKLAGTLALVYFPARKLLNLFAGAKAIKGMTKFAGATRIVSKSLRGSKASFALGATSFTKLGKAASGATPKVGGLASIFAGGGAAWGLLGSVGVVYGILALNEALKETPQQKYDKTKKELSGLKDTYKDATNELEKLQKKQKEKGETGKELADSEKQRLHYLEQQTKELEKQIDKKKELLNKQWEEKEGKKVKNRKESERAGKTIEQGSGNIFRGFSDKDLGQLGLSDDITNKVEKYKRVLGGIATEYRNTGMISKESLDKQKKSIESVKKEQESWLKHFGKVSKMPKEFRSVYEESKKLTNAYDYLDKLQEQLAGGNWGDLTAKQASKAEQKFKDLGGAIGVTLDESGDISNIDYNQFVAGLDAAGISADQAQGALEQLAKTNPNMKVNIDGIPVAVNQIETVQDFLDKLNGDDAKATVEVDGVEYAVEDIGNVENLLQLLDGKDTKTNLTVEGAKDAFHKIKYIEDTDLTDKKVKIKGDNSGAKKSIKEADKLKPKDKTLIVKGKQDASFTNAKNKLENTKSKSVVLSIGAKASDLAQKALKKLGFASGTRHAPSGFAEVNEQGFEFIRDAKTGKLRIAGGGKRTVTALGEGDIVYTHAESKRMVSDKADIEIPQHKKGKKSAKSGKSAKQQRQEKYDNKVEKKIFDKYDEDLKTLDYKKQKYHWTEAQYNAQYKKLNQKYRKKLKSFNKKYKGKKAKGVKKTKGLGSERERALELAQSDLMHDNATQAIDALMEAYNGSDDEYARVATAIQTALNAQQISADEANELRKELDEKRKDFKHDAATKAVESWLNDKRGTDENFQKTLEKINQERQLQNLSAEEALEYEKEAYKKHLEYTMNTLKFDKATYQKSMAMLNDYYAKAKITEAEYYEYRQELAEKALDLERKEIGKSQALNDNKYNLAKMYVQKQIDALQKENDEQEKQNQLIELQNDLLKAKSKRVKIYREGIGFVYEQDTESIQEATKALQDYQKTQDNPELEKWQKIMDLFDDLESRAEMVHLENAIGSTAVGLFGGFGADVGDWTTWIKRNLAAQYGYADVLDMLDDLVDYSDIESFLGNVDQKIKEAIEKNFWGDATYKARKQKAAELMQLYREQRIRDLMRQGKSRKLAERIVMRESTQLENQYYDSLGDLSVAGQYHKMGSLNNGNNSTYNFDKLVLPNVTDANSFINELNKLPNKALQYSKGRV